MERLIVAAVIIAVVGAVALVVKARRRPDAPTQRRFHVPEQVDRRDFSRPDAAWLVVVFTSATCDVCRSVAEKAAVLESGDVAVAEVEHGAARRMHERYRVEAVPTTIVCGADGVTRAGFIGPVTATDLWAAVAEVREPGSTPEPHLGHRHET
jgi:Thioredoxin